MGHNEGSEDHSLHQKCEITNPNTHLFVSVVSKCEPTAKIKCKIVKPRAGYSKREDG